MSRYDREAKLEALYGGKDGLVLVTERGGRKRDKRKVLTDRMSKLMAEQPQPGTDVHQPSSAPVMGSYQRGTLGTRGRLTPAAEATPEMLDELTRMLGEQQPEVREPDARMAETGEDYSDFSIPEGALADETSIMDLLRPDIDRLKEFLGMEPEIPKGEPGLFSPKALQPLER